MKRYLCFMLVLLSGSLALAEAGEQLDLTGSWQTADSAAVSFSLDLTQNVDRVSGYHCAVARHGNRLDTVLPGEGAPSITGVVTGKNARIQFRSGYGDNAHGEASLELQKDGTLKWKTIQSEGVHYFPNEATLRRQKAANSKHSS